MYTHFFKVLQLCLGLPELVQSSICNEVMQHVCKDTYSILALNSTAAWYTELCRGRHL